MRKDVKKLLNDLNRKFYDDFAESFAASRAKSEPGLEKILRNVREQDCVLDLGCGQGRIALLLPKGCTYVGMDFSGAMLAEAQGRADAAQVKASFHIGDLLSAPWPFLGENFDWVILRAVLHHIPGLENRVNILRRAAELVAGDGHIVLANWQFMEIPRLRKRIQNWSKISLTSEDVESGDYLLDWQRDGYGLRYVHLVDEAETATLAEQAGLHISELFRADGHQNRLTLYATLHL